jgi:hypothetical protein
MIGEDASDHRKFAVNCTRHREFVEPSEGVSNASVAIRRPISLTPVSWLLSFLTPSGSDFALVLKVVRRFRKHTARAARRLF